MAPGVADHTLRDEPAHREMHVQAVTALVPLRHPHVGERRTAGALSQIPEEGPQVSPHLYLVVAAFAPVSQSPKPVEQVGRAVPAQLAPSPTTSLSTCPLRIPGRSTGDVGRNRAVGGDEAAASLTSLRVHRQNPTRRAGGSDSDGTSEIGHGHSTNGANRDR